MVNNYSVSYVMTPLCLPYDTHLDLVSLAPINNEWIKKKEGLNVPEICTESGDFVKPLVLALWVQLTSVSLFVT